VGNFWKYSSESHLYEYYLSKEVVAFGVMREGMMAFKIRYLRSYTYSSDTVEKKKEWITYQALIGNEIREFYNLNDPGQYEILLRFPLEVGSSWHEPPRQMDSVWVFSIFVDSVVALENIVTPAGEFEE
jgi:hypothetical protein